MRDDDGNGLCGILRGMYADIRDEVAGFEDGLEALEGDVLVGTNILNQSCCLAEKEVNANLPPPQQASQDS